MTKYLLVSFKACPWVQRAAIVLREKNVAFETRHIEPDNRPDWFLAISPHKKVPVLRIDDTVSLFESNAIAEYLDETIKPQLHPADPVRRAINRAWTDYLPTFTATTNAAAFAQTEAEFKDAVEKMAGPFGLMEAALSADGPYFNGKDYALVDAAYAPFLQRHLYLEKIAKHGQLQRFPRFHAWAKALVARPSTHSFPEAEAEATYRAVLKRWKPKTWLSQFIDDEKAAAE